MQGKLETLQHLHNTLQSLIGVHRQLLEVMRLERDALREVNLDQIKKITQTKKSLVESFYPLESKRTQQVKELSMYLGIPPESLSLSQLIIALQAVKAEWSETFRTDQNTLKILIQRIIEQNQANDRLIESSLFHIHEMKKNSVGKKQENLANYNLQGKKTLPHSSAFLLFKEV